MKTSEAGCLFIKQEEGCSLAVYADPVGYPTIGVGHLILDGEDFSTGITDEQAMALLAQDLDHAEDCVNRNVTVRLAQNQFDALVSFVFNIGTGAFKKSTLLRKLNAHLYEEVPAQMGRWHYAGGVPHVLDNRRAAEVALWLSNT